jgi:hypothetical protein
VPSQLARGLSWTWEMLTLLWARGPREVGRRAGSNSRLRRSAHGCEGKLRRKDSNLRRRWLTATRSTAELLRTVRTGSRHAPGDACRLSLCVVHRGPGGLQDGPGCATPAVGDPCRTRTCVRCVKGSRPGAGRTGRGSRRAEGGGFEPGGLRADSNGRPLPSEGSALFC